MRSAISPETPVSISSNTIVGSFTAPAINALIESITRAISPPEATEEIFCKVPFLLAENRKLTVSSPCNPGSFFSPISIWKRTFGIPNGIKRAANCFSTSRAAFVRALVSSSACCFTCLYCSSLRTVSSAIRSSYEVMSDNLLRYSSVNAINSSRVCARCFCCRE